MLAGQGFRGFSRLFYIKGAVEQMPNVGYGDEIRDRAWNLLSALMKRQRQGKQGVELHSDDKGELYLEVQAKLSEIAQWTNLSIEKVREILNQYLGEKFLRIMTPDENQKKAGRGAENRHFKITLWSKNLQENEECFKKMWADCKKEKAKEKKQLSKFSQVLNSNYQISSESRVDVILCFDEEDKNIAKEIKERLEAEGMKVMLDTGYSPSQSYRMWEKQAIEQTNSVAVLVGSHDSVPWKIDKKRSLLNKFYRRKRSLITVLLPNASSDSFKQKSAPYYLRDKEAVDFTKGVSTEGINYLVYGITGEEQSKKRKFLTMISHNDKNEKTDKSITIILPVFPIGKYLEEQSEVNNPKQGAAKNLNKKNTRTAILNDVMTTFQISFSFHDNHLPLPVVKGDEEDINFHDKEKGTYILVGLSNRKITELNTGKYVAGKYFNIEIIYKEGYNLFVLKCARFDNHNELAEEWDHYEENQDKPYNYALFAKFQVDSKKIIVFGGITETATHRLGLYFNRHWEDVFNKLKAEKGGSLDSNDLFAVVIKTPGDKVSQDDLDLSKFRILTACIKKNT